MNILKTTAHASIFLLGFSIVRSIVSILVRSSIVSFFGAGSESDAYFAAFTVPQQVGDLFIGGILMAVIIPVFHERRAESGEKAAANDISGILNLSLLTLLILGTVYFLIIPILVPKLFPGFDELTTSLTISLARWLAPTLVLMGLSLVYVSFHHAHRDFVTPAIANLLFPLSSLAAVWLLPGDWGIHRLAYGNLIGSILGLALLICAIHDRIPWRWNWHCWNPAVRSVVLLAWPVLFANFVAKLVPFVQKNVASTLDAGSLTLLDYALFITEAILAFIAAPIATAIYPMLCEQRSQEGESTMFGSFLEALGLVIFLAAPCVIIQFSASKEIALVLFGYGRFTAENIAVCATLLSITAIMIIPQCIATLSGRVFFAIQETKTPSAIGIILTLGALPCYFIFGHRFGVYGLAAVWTGTYVALGATQLLILKNMRKSLSIRKFSKDFLRLLLAAGIMSASIAVIRPLSNSVPFPLLRFAIIAATGFPAYLLVNHILGGKELNFVLKRLPLIQPLRERMGL